MKKYGLIFISDHDIYEHVKVTVLKYRFEINLKKFINNLIDPIKLTFDSKVYRKDIEEILEDEIIRQLDKSNTNHIGYFNQNIFRYLDNGWVVPKIGYDVVNEEQSIYVEMKNKHNTMNSSSAQKTYIRMQNTLLKNPAAKCFLVEVIAKNSQDMIWKTTIDGFAVSDERIRKMSIDKFYEMVTGDPNAFKNLCVTLPNIIEDVVRDVKLSDKSNTVIEELKKIDKNLIKSIYMISFKKYEGFSDFHI